MLLIRLGLGQRCFFSPLIARKIACSPHRPAAHHLTPDRVVLPAHPVLMILFVYPVVGARSAGNLARSGAEFNPAASVGVGDCRPRAGLAPVRWLAC